MGGAVHAKPLNNIGEVTMTPSGALVRANRRERPAFRNTEAKSLLSTSQKHIRGLP